MIDKLSISNVFFVKLLHLLPLFSSFIILFIGVFDLQYLPILLVCGFVGFFVYSLWYESTDHCVCKDTSALRQDAKPVDLQRKVINSFGRKKYRTTLVFDDGFRYISHKTNTENHALSYTISISASDNAELLQKAVAAHADYMQNK